MTDQCDGAGFAGKSGEPGSRILEEVHGKVEEMMNETTFAILRHIKGCWDRDGFAPTVREMRDALGISSTSVVTYHVKSLAAVGLLTHKRNAARTLRLTEKGLDALREETGSGE